MGSSRFTGHAPSPCLHSGPVVETVPRISEGRGARGVLLFLILHRCLCGLVELLQLRGALHITGADRGLQRRTDLGQFPSPRRVHWAVHAVQVPPLPLLVPRPVPFRPRLPPALPRAAPPRPARARTVGPSLLLALALPLAGVEGDGHGLVRPAGVVLAPQPHPLLALRPALVREEGQRRRLVRWAGMAAIVHTPSHAVLLRPHAHKLAHQLPHLLPVDFPVPCGVL